MKGASNTSFTLIILEGASNRGRASNTGEASIMRRGVVFKSFRFLTREKQWCYDIILDMP